MPSSTSQAVRARAAYALGACLRRPWLSERAVKQAIASLFALGIILGLTGRGHDRESLAAAMHPQQPPAQSSSPSPSPGAPDGEPEAASLRSETLEQLKTLGAATTPDPSTPSGPGRADPAASPTAGSAAAKADASPPTASLSPISGDILAQKPLQKLLQDRLRLLDAYGKLTLAQKKATNPESSPEHQAAQAKAELKRIEALLSQADSSPETLLPPALRKSSGTAPAVRVSEIKDAIEATSHELAEWKAKFEAQKTGKAQRESQRKARAADRDKVFQRVTTLKAKSVEYETAVTDASSRERGRFAQERLVNYQWEVRVESLRLQVIETEMDLEVKLADTRELEAQIGQAHIQLAKRALDLLQARYRAETEQQESDLTRAAANEKSKAQWSGDPLERFRARRKAELLELEAQVIKYEQALAMSPSPSFQEQQTLADHADKDFARVKELLVDGSVSRLDAIRLNNEFRRIGPERERLVRNEMAAVEAHLQFFEDALTNAEIELLQDSLHDRFEHDLLRERVSPDRWADGERLLIDLERSHRAILERRRLALEKLSERASHTLKQIARRLAILDQEYGFIRTQIFWVRDQDPIAVGTFWQGAREFQYLLSALLRLAQETMKPNLWYHPSAEFMVTALAVLTLPIALVKLRRALGGLIHG